MISQSTMQVIDPTVKHGRCIEGLLLDAESLQRGVNRQIAKLPPEILDHQEDYDLCLCWTIKEKVKP